MYNLLSIHVLRNSHSILLGRTGTLGKASLPAAPRKRSEIAQNTSAAGSWRSILNGQCLEILLRVLLFGY